MTGPVLPLASGSLDEAAAALAEGLVVGVPTDTVYGLAADPLRPEAVARLFALKERPAEVALPILVGSRQQAETVAGPLTGSAAHLADRFWPGPLTLVVPRLPRFTADLGGPPAARQTVGVRWLAHPGIERLCRAVGPLAVTSANLHGTPPATTAQQVVAVFAGVGGPAAVLDGGTCAGTPSSVIECRGPAWRCLREGAVSWDDLTGPGRRGQGPAGRS